MTTYHPYPEDSPYREESFDFSSMNVWVRMAFPSETSYRVLIYETKKQRFEDGECLRLWMHIHFQDPWVEVTGPSGETIEMSKRDGLLFKIQWGEPSFDEPSWIRIGNCRI